MRRSIEGYVNRSEGYKKREGGTEGGEGRREEEKEGQSYLMFPTAHTHCSRTSAEGWRRRWIKGKVAPASTKARVWVVEPMLIKAQEASYRRMGEALSREICPIRRGRNPWVRICSTGGLRSTDRSLRTARVASNSRAASPERMSRAYMGRSCTEGGA